MIAASNCDNLFQNFSIHVFTFLPIFFVSLIEEYAKDDIEGGIVSDDEEELVS
jgi:hypothetical protein